MKRVLVVLWAATLAGCLQSVDVAADFKDLDAGPEPKELDAGPRPPPCGADTDCEQPPRNLCEPTVAFCDSGSCATRAMTEKEFEPLRGTCDTAADCGCQGLSTPGCVGAFACDAGLCKFACDTPSEDCSIPEAKTCKTDEACGLDNFCEKGCCIPCPVMRPAPCAEGQCHVYPDRDARGCLPPPICEPCPVQCICPGVVDPVCGTDFRDYGNACQAACQGAKVLHAGECLPGEGMSCSSTRCVPDLVCRDACPACDDIKGADLRCVAEGVCYQDSDCGAGASLCSAGARLKCVAYACVCE